MGGVDNALPCDNFASDLEGRSCSPRRERAWSHGHIRSTPTTASSRRSASCSTFAETYRPNEWRF